VQTETYSTVLFDITVLCLGVFRLFVKTNERNINEIFMFVLLQI